MTSERTQAYTRVIKTLEDLGPTKLHGLEQDVIRDAADTLIFAVSATEDDAATAVANVETLVEHLTATGRWSAERASELLDDIFACGPNAPAPLRAAA